MRLLLKAATELMDAYRRTPGIKPEVFARTGAYRQFVEAELQAGFTGPDVEMDSDFAERRPQWVAGANDEELRRWVHTMLRADRWNGDYPTALWDACRSGAMSALVERLES